MADIAAPSACPACAGVPKDVPAVEAQGDILLSVPDMRCAACISTIEAALASVPGVREARVNYSLRRAAISAREGVSPEALIDALDAVGYRASELDTETLAATGTDTAGRALLTRVAVAGFAMMNVMLLSVSVWSGASDATRDLLHLVSALIAVPATGYAAMPFFTSAAGALSHRRLNMDVPISLAILLAVAMSLFETLEGGAHAYFDAALSLTFFLLVGRYLEHRARATARSAAEELAALEVPKALLVADGGDVKVAVSDLRPGDLVRIPPGARVPCDGEIVEGASDVDQAFLTGESLPVALGVGASLNAGAVNLTGPMVMRVTAVGPETVLGRMSALVRLAESAKHKYSSLADRAAQIYAPGVHMLAAFAFAGWFWATGDLRLSLGIAIAVLIITCPCALGLAVPAVITSISGRLFRGGVLLKNDTALERLAEVDMVVFDKTGTLTFGAPELVGTVNEAALAQAAALAVGSSHPLARALAEEAGDRALVIPEARSVIEHPGLGLEGKVAGRTVRLGRAEWVGAIAGTGTETWVAIDGDAPVSFRFRDRPRPGAAKMLQRLDAAGIRVALLSGDTEAATQSLGDALGIDEVTARATPEDKAAIVRGYTDQGHKVLMVGDGLNDTAALSGAHAALAPGSALDAARVSADGILLGDSLDGLAGTLNAARVARSRILQNFAIAAGYNAVAIPIALAGLASPLLAALAMSTSSILVILNAVRPVR